MATAEADNAEELRQYVEAFSTIMTTECRRKIGRIMINHRNVTHFSLPHDDVGEFSDLAWELLGKFIARNTHLYSLHLSDSRNLLTDRTMSILW